MTWNRDQRLITLSNNSSSWFFFKPRWSCIITSTRFFINLWISFAEWWTTFCHNQIIISTSFSYRTHLNMWYFTLSLTSFLHTDFRFETHCFLNAIVDWAEAGIYVAWCRFFGDISFFASFVYCVEKSLESKRKFRTCSGEHWWVMFFQF